MRRNVDAQPRDVDTGSNINGYSAQERRHELGRIV